MSKAFMWVMNGAGGGPTVDDLEHGGLQLEVVAAVEIVAQGAHDGGPGLCAVQSVIRQLPKHLLWG